MGRNGKKSGRKPAARQPRGSLDKRPAVDPSGHGGRVREHPAFSFRWADSGGEHPCCFDPGDDAAELVTFLCEMNKLTWNEIRSQMTGGRNRHKKHHYHPIEGLGAPVKSALARRPDLEEQVDSDLFRFRLGGTKRLWGFVEEETFHVLWWDPNHEVYPTDPA